MNTTSTAADSIRQLLHHPEGAIVGLVDDLLNVCGENELELDWRYGNCRVRSSDGAWEEFDDGLPRKSIFRTVLARIAVLCSEFENGSFSPYGGQGKVSPRVNSSVVLQVAFVNTTDEQSLRIWR